MQLHDIQHRVEKQKEYIGKAEFGEQVFPLATHIHTGARTADQTYGLCHCTV